MGLTGSGQDANLENAVEGASRQIDSITGRRFYQDGTVTTRYFTPDNSFYLFVPDISTLTGLVVKLDDNDDGTHETTITINTDFIVEPVNAGQNQVQYQPFTKIRILDTRSSQRFDASIVNNVKVEAKWGFVNIPDAIKQATLLQATRLFKRKDTPFTTYGGQSTGAINLQFNFDDDAMELIKGYKKNKL